MNYSTRLYTTLALILMLTGLCIVWIMHRQPTQTPHAIILKPATFSELPGWQAANMKGSLRSFQLSCERLLNQNPDKFVGNQWMSLQIKDWVPACKQALSMRHTTSKSARNFFQTWFSPVVFDDSGPITGLFTGYFAPRIKGSLVKTDIYSTPVYSTPKNLVKIKLQEFDPELPARDLYGRIHHGRMIPYYSRADIDKGALVNQAQVIAYTRNPIDRLLIEIQGSGVLELEDGSEVNLGYAGKNGLRYLSIGRTLLDQGKLDSKNISMQSITDYLETHPEERDAIINTNRSFVFFKILSNQGAFGTLGAPLTPGYSIAVDPNWVPLGMPVWLSATRPDSHSDSDVPLHRLLIAQDTGGAIKGTVRGDVFWGSSTNSAVIAGRMKHHGQYWLLYPKITPN